MSSKTHNLRNKLNATAQRFLETKTGAFLNEKLGFRDHDLPLNKSDDTRFLVLLISLMSFLTILTLSGVFILNNITERWSSGLENKVTIEIPIETKNGQILSQKTVKKETTKLEKNLKRNPVIKSVKVLSSNDIQELISPWIGENLTLDDLPLPGLIALELHKSDKDTLIQLKQNIAEISSFAYLETHHEWLAEIISFARTLKMLSIIISVIIVGTTVTAITAGMHTRMAIHKKEVDLLHAIGASDHYIARQFQRYAMILTLKGALTGTLAGGMITAIFVFMSSQSNISLIPTIHLGAADTAILITTPFIAAAIATLASRFTVLRSLSKMP